MATPRSYQPEFREILNTNKMNIKKSETNIRVEYKTQALKIVKTCS